MAYCTLGVCEASHMGKVLNNFEYVLTNENIGRCLMVTREHTLVPLTAH